MNGMLMLGPFSVDIPAGTRIAARAASTTADSTAITAVTLCDTDIAWPTADLAYNSYGVVDNADNKFTATVDPGAVADTKGAWVEIVAEVDDAAQSIDFIMGQRSDYVRADGHFLIDIGIEPKVRIAVKKRGNGVLRGLRRKLMQEGIGY